MRPHVICCEKCFRYVNQRNKEASTLWLNFLKHHHDAEFVFLHYTFDFSPDFIWLEQERFTVSTEVCYEWISFKLQGVNEESGIVCVKKHNKRKKKE